MRPIPVNTVGALGVINDRKPHELPLQAWSDSRNMRFRDGFAEKFLGESLFDATSIDPYWLLPVPTATSFYWLVAGLTKVHSLTGGVETDITRTVGGDYGATAQLNWTGCVFNGIPVINNGVDEPQMWTPVSGAQPLQALSNWPASTTCRALRAFRNFLVAGDVVKSGTRYRQMVKWSHPAGIGALPSSWDETDPTKDAGEWPLAETGGSIIDFSALRDLNIIYKDDSVYKMQYVGGEFVFKFSNLTKFVGILSRRCMTEYQPGYHAFMGQSDLLRHDGQQVVSLLEKRMRRWLEANLDPTYYERSFVFTNQLQKEVWFCFPAAGNQFPSLAIVWQWADDTLTVRELNNMSHAANGILNSVDDTWDSDTGIWDDDTSVWDALTYNPAALNIVAAFPEAAMLRAVDFTNQINGTNMTAYLERTGLGIPLKLDSPPDFTTKKFFSELWPRLEGTDGGVVNISVGVQDSIDGAVTWKAPQSFVIGTTEKIEADISGRLLAVRFESSTDVEWRLHGYEVVVTKDGDY